MARARVGSPRSRSSTLIQSYCTVPDSTESLATQATTTRSDIAGNSWLPTE
jgi:hypothetical protein